MNTASLLKIDLKAYWHAGGGRGGGAVVDAVVHRDSNNLPVIPGRHLKGLLRDALERAEDWGWMGYAGTAEQYFGTRTEKLEQGDIPVSSCIRVADARLPDDIATWLASSQGKIYQPRLFRQHYSTAIEQGTSVAVDQSLRGQELTVPLLLESTLSVISGRDAPDDWLKKLNGVLPLIDAIGAMRTRGLGRAVLSLESKI